VRNKIILYNPRMDLPRPNTPARLSLISAMLTVSFFCIGFAPFLPMTALFCYPAAFLGAFFSLLSGLLGLRRPAGRWMAWMGIVVGALVILGVMAFTILALLMLPALADGLIELWQSLVP
jgi:hypothetical protein